MTPQTRQRAGDRLDERVAVIGLGYVGLPVALAFARVAEQAIGFDIDPNRVAELRAGQDSSGAADPATLKSSKLQVTDRGEALAGSNFFVVGVPTPVDREKRPDLGPLAAACRSIAGVLEPGAMVVIESTVYPGATEELCGPILAESSGLVQGRDFQLAYSPERINPGDREHTLQQVVKIVAAEDSAGLNRVARAYGAIVEAGLHRAPSIKVAEAAKVIENTQRDLNIALMNELSLIFDRLGIPTQAVLEAAGSKWNFLPFRPGLVGGHCIGVDPYYLTSRAVQSGYQPEVILAGRRINDEMGRVVARKTVRLLARSGRCLTEARVGILGLTFKEDVPDLRNSKVVDLVEELRSFAVEPLLHDVLADAVEVARLFGRKPDPLIALDCLDALILAVPHAAYRAMGEAEIAARIADEGIFIDLKSAFPEMRGRDAPLYWAL